MRRTARFSLAAALTKHGGGACEAVEAAPSPPDFCHRFATPGWIHKKISPGVKFLLNFQDWPICNEP
ncbi:MAG TPA: hypothetical protein VHB73_00125 [Alphaproteobacteria bacterium]|nr:hypothetical protein [Alphaproteobacteria bacterium]